MKRFTELLKQFWAALDGNKTAVGGVIFTILYYAPLPQPYQSILVAVITAWTGISFAHHVQKGYFRKDKGH